MYDAPVMNIMHQVELLQIEHVVSFKFKRFVEQCDCIMNWGRKDKQAKISARTQMNATYIVLKILLLKSLLKRNGYFQE